MFVGWFSPKLIGRVSLLEKISAVIMDSETVFFHLDARERSPNEYKSPQSGKAFFAKKNRFLDLLHNSPQMLDTIHVRKKIYKNEAQHWFSGDAGHQSHEAGKIVEKNAYPVFHLR